MHDFWQYVWSPGNHNKLEDRSFTKKTYAWTWIWTRDLLHVKPVCYQSATVTWYMEVSKVGFLNSLKIPRWPLFLSEINKAISYLTYLFITLNCKPCQNDFFIKQHNIRFRYLKFKKCWIWIFSLRFLMTNMFKNCAQLH